MVSLQPAPLTLEELPKYMARLIWNKGKMEVFFQRYSLELFWMEAVSPGPVFLEKPTQAQLRADLKLLLVMLAVTEYHNNVLGGLLDFSDLSFYDNKRSFSFGNPASLRSDDRRKNGVTAAARVLVGAGR